MCSRNAELCHHIAHIIENRSLWCCRNTELCHHIVHIIKNRSLRCCRNTELSQCIIHIIKNRSLRCCRYAELCHHIVLSLSNRCFGCSRCFRRCILCSELSQDIINCFSLCSLCGLRGNAELCHDIIYGFSGSFSRYRCRSRSRFRNCKLCKSIVLCRGTLRCRCRHGELRQDIIGIAHDSGRCRSRHGRCRSILLLCKNIRVLALVCCKCSSGRINSSLGQCELRQIAQCKTTVGSCCRCRTGRLGSFLLCRRNILCELWLRRCEGRNLCNTRNLGHYRSRCCGSNRNLGDNRCFSGTLCCFCLSLCPSGSCTSLGCSLLCLLLLTFLLNISEGYHVWIIAQNLCTLLLLLEHTIHFSSVGFQNSFCEYCLALLTCNLSHQTECVVYTAADAEFGHVLRFLQVDSAAGPLFGVGCMHGIALCITNQKNLHSNPPIQILLYNHHNTFHTENQLFFKIFLI